MSKNKIIIIFTMISLIIIIAIPTIYAVINNHNNKLLEVSNKKIVEAAKECYLRDLCSKNRITLKELYETEFLKDKEADPITKIYYNEASYVDVKNNFEFIVIK